MKVALKFALKMGDKDSKMKNEESKQMEQKEKQGVIQEMTNDEQTVPVIYSIACKNYNSPHGF